jgi:hypothetical protein
MMLRASVAVARARKRRALASTLSKTKAPAPMFSPLSIGPLKLGSPPPTSAMKLARSGSTTSRVGSSAKPIGFTYE